MTNPKSFIFKWEIKNIDPLFRTVPNDDATRLILEHLPKNGFVLEGGCGTARFVYFLKDLGYKVLGLEYDQGILSQVKQHYPDLELLSGDVAVLPVADDSLYGMISLGVIEHFPEGPERALREMYRTLRPGARAIITVPYYNQIRKIKAAVGIYKLRNILKGNSLLRRIFGKSPLSIVRLSQIAKGWYVNFGAGDFYEYWLTQEEFQRAVTRAGFVLVQTKLISHLDGLYIELGPLFVTFRDNEFTLRPLGRIAIRILEQLKWSYNNMQLCVALKPK